MVVYFAQPFGGGPIKIGVSKDPVRRVRSLSGPSGIPIEIKATAPGGVFLEGYLHYKFRVHRLRWEWFRPVPEIYELIEAVRVNGHVPGTGGSAADERADGGDRLAVRLDIDREGASRGAVRRDHADCMRAGTGSGEPAGGDDERVFVAADDSGPADGEPVVDPSRGCGGFDLVAGGGRVCRPDQPEDGLRRGGLPVSHHLRGVPGGLQALDQGQDARGNVLGLSRSGQSHQYGKQYQGTHSVSPSVFALAVEAGRRIAAARLHLAEGFRALNDARRGLSNPIASSSLPADRHRVAGANCPEAVSSGSPGPSFGRLPVVLHDRNHGDDQWNIPPVKMGENP